MKILELELLSDNLTETERFYKNVLKLEPYQRDSGERLFYQVGFTRLIFKKSDNVKPVYHFAIDVPNNRFRDIYEIFKSKVPLLPVNGNDIADFSNWDAESFYFYDNNGNVVELITRYANHAYSNKPFSAESYISLSEVGLVAIKVPDLADRLKKKFGVPIFHRQPRGKRFTVSGDDEGLFILAESGREWYPVKIKAYAYRTRVIFMLDGVIHQFMR